MPFVTFEGIDGSGKSTQARRLSDHLAHLGNRVVSTREPWGGRLGKAVRALLTDPELAQDLCPTEEMLLIAAARYDHVRSIIQPGLAKGGWVVCDRFTDATYAYQIHGLLDEPLGAAISNLVCGSIAPDVTFVLDVEPELAASRLSLRRDDLSADPAETRRNFSRIRQGFLATVDEDAIAAQILDILKCLELLP